MPAAQPKSQSRDAGVLLHIHIHMSQCAQSRLCLRQIGFGIFQSQVRQLVVDMMNGNTSLLQFQTEERVFVTIFAYVFVKANRKEQAARDKEVESRELRIREATSIVERQPLLSIYFIVVTQSLSWAGAFGDITKTTANDLCISGCSQIVSNIRRTANLSVSIHEEQPFAFSFTGQSVSDGSSPKVVRWSEETASRRPGCFTVLMRNLFVRRAIIAHNDFTILRELLQQLMHKTATVVIVCGNKDGEFHNVKVR